MADTSCFNSASHWTRRGHIRDLAILLAVVMSISPLAYSQATGAPGSEKKGFPPLGLTQEQIVRYLEGDYQFGPPQLRPNGLVEIDALNAATRTMLSISKAENEVIMTTFYFQPQDESNDVNAAQIVRRTGALIRFLKNTAPEVAWDEPDESRTIGTIIGTLSRQPGMQRREVGTRVVVFRRAVLQQPLIEVHVHSKDL